MTRATGLAALVVAGLAMGTGCAVNLGSAEHTAHQVTTFGTAEYLEAGSLLVQLEAGDVEIEESPGRMTVEARVRAETRERAEAAQVTHRVSEEGRLEISVEWPGGERWENESCDLVVRVPRMEGVWVRTSAGDIEVTGMGGELLIETSAGDVEVERHEGSVTVVTSAGDIEISDVSGSVSAQTKAGDIELRGVHTPVTASTSAGDIEARLAGPGRGTLVAVTSVGDLRVNGKEIEGKRAEVTMGEGSEISRLESSVGDVRVTAPGG